MKLVITVECEPTEEFATWVRESGTDPGDSLYHKDEPMMPLLLSVADYLNFTVKSVGSYSLDGWTVYTEEGYRADTLDKGGE